MINSKGCDPAFVPCLRRWVPRIGVATQRRTRRFSWTPTWTPSPPHSTSVLKAAPERAPWRPAIGICPQISDAELVTLAVLQALLAFTSEARWLRHTRKHLTGLFPRLPGQSGYNKRLRKLAATMCWLTPVLAADTTLWHDNGG